MDGDGFDAGVFLRLETGVDLLYSDAVPVDDHIMVHLPEKQ